MNKMGLWFWYSAKRQLKRKIFIGLLILLPILFAGAGYLEARDEKGIQVALYGNLEESLTNQVFHRLLQEKGTFQFYISSSREELEADVAGRKAECGYVFAEDFEERLKQGEARRSIVVCRAPSTTVDILSTEVVFAGLMEVYGQELLLDYMDASQLFEVSDDLDEKAEMQGLWEKYMENGSTFSFTYQDLEGRQMEDAKGTVSVPARGIVAVYLFMIGLFGAVMQASDEKNGLFLSVPYGQKTGCRLASLAAPVALAGLSGYISLWASGSLGSWWKELAVIIAYGAAIVIFSYLLKQLIPNPLILCSLIPVFLMGSLLLCPVILDIGKFVPGLKPLGKCFLPYYYLWAAGVFL